MKHPFIDGNFEGPAFGSVVSKIEERADFLHWKLLSMEFYRIRQNDIASFFDNVLQVLTFKNVENLLKNFDLKIRKAKPKVGAQWFWRSW